MGTHWGPMDFYLKVFQLHSTVEHQYMFLGQLVVSRAT